MAKRLFHLRDVVDVNALQEIQDRFSDATGLASIIVDYQGKPVVRYSNFSDFCARVRQTASGRQGCEQSDAHAGLEAARQGRPYIYCCHMGLVDIAAPIIVQGQYLGSIMAGQVLAEDDQLLLLERIARPGINLALEPELKFLLKKIPLMPFAKIKAAGQLMYTIANSIAEKGVASLIQEELHEQKIRLMEEMKSRAELERALKEAELMVLQSQINPHFLFNTLNAISRLALLEGADRTQEVVYALAELLRGSLRKAGQLAPLREELSYVHNYLLIQQTRYPDRLKVEFDVEEDCLQSEIPLLTLQPLVENAIVHGLEPKEAGGTLWLRIMRLGDQVQIEIIDDGLGMPEDVVEEIKKLDRTRTGRCHVTGLGVNNVVKRLQYHFGDEFQWQIQSEIGQGTHITIYLPYRPSKVGDVT
ncbi:MAG: PocR ligand-binding domain-containing protein [bacterium]|nr:histidine kinase [Bacillota bacterium]